MSTTFRALSMGVSFLAERFIDEKRGKPTKNPELDQPPRNNE